MKKVIIDTNLWISFLLLALADTIEADYIVSGDADLTDLRQYHQARIIKLSDFKQFFL